MGNEVFWTVFGKFETHQKFGTHTKEPDSSMLRTGELLVIFATKCIINSPSENSLDLYVSYISSKVGGFSHHQKSFMITSSHSKIFEVTKKQIILSCTMWFEQHVELFIARVSFVKPEEE